jgi:predicted permease
LNPPQGDFLSALLLSSEVIGKLLLVAAAGFFVVRRGILHEDGIKGISRLMIDFIVPCSLGVGMLKGFSVDAMTTISPLILLPVLWIAFSSVLAIGYFRLLPSKGNSADNVAVALCAIPNSFYVPLPVVMALVAPADQVMAAMLVGAAVLAINPLQWTLGMWLVMGERSREANWKESMQGMLNGPVIGVVGGAILSQFPAMVSAAKGDATSNMILRMIVGAAQMAGSAMGPLAMLIIGALIGSISLRQQFSIRHLLPILLFRFLLVPRRDLPPPFGRIYTGRETGGTRAPRRSRLTLGDEPRHRRKTLRRRLGNRLRAALLRQPRRRRHTPPLDRRRAAPPLSRATSSAGSASGRNNSRSTCRRNSDSCATPAQNPSRSATSIPTSSAAAVYRRPSPDSQRGRGA